MSSINSLLRMGFVFLLLFIMGQAGALFWTINNNNNMVHRAINDDFGSSILVSRMAIEGNKLRRYEKEFFIYIGNREKLTKYKHEWETSFTKLEEMLKKSQSDTSNSWSSVERLQLDDWMRSLQEYGKGFRQVTSDVYNGDIVDTISANKAVGPAKNKFRVFLNGTEKDGKMRFDRASQVAKKIDKSNQLLAILLLGTAIAGILISLVLMIVIPKAITNSISLLSEAAEKMSKGKLDEIVPVDEAKKEFHILAETLERMRISQKTLIQRIRSHAKTGG